MKMNCTASSAEWLYYARFGRDLFLIIERGEAIRHPCHELPTNSLFDISRCQLRISLPYLPVREQHDVLPKLL